MMYELPTIDDIRRAKAIRQSIAQAIREGRAKVEDYGLDENGLIAIGPIENDGLRRVARIGL